MMVIADQPTRNYMNTLSKVEFPGLFDAGIKMVSMDMLHALTVERFEDSESRKRLYNNLSDWISKLQSYGIHGSLWIDGSFVTEKLNPGDIDCLLEITNIDQPLTQNEIQALNKTLFNHDFMKVGFSLDTYFQDVRQPDIQQRRSYWRRWFGFARDGTTEKGFLELRI